MNPEDSEVRAQLDQITESIRVMAQVGEGLKSIGVTVSHLMTNLETAVVAQQETEEARRHDSERARYRFWITIGGVVLANLIVVSISIAVLLNQQAARELSDDRSRANRDRQSCSTSLLVEWDAKLGNALRVTTQLPPVDRQSREYQSAIDELNAATELIGKAKELCYGPEAVPDPVPAK